MYDFRAGISIENSRAHIRDAPYPLVPYRQGFISFAPIDVLGEYFGPNLTIKLLGENETDSFLEKGWLSQDIEWYDATNQFKDLVRQGFEQYFASRGLGAYVLANGRRAWWATVSAAPVNRISFNWGEISGSRKIQGISLRRNVHWHYGVSLEVHVIPIRHVRIIGRLIFTEDGELPLESVSRAHRLRRSFAKSWRNARWRDMMLAFLYWLAEEKNGLALASGSGEEISIVLPPLSFEAPITVVDSPDASHDNEDDPINDDGDYNFADD